MSGYGCARPPRRPGALLNARCHTQPLARGEGLSLIELLLCLGVAATLTAVAVPQVLSGLDEYRTRGAVRYLSGRLQSARAEAINRSANTAIRFVATDRSYFFATYVDGDGDGVLSRDILAGIDAQQGSADAIAARFPGVDLGLGAGLPAADGSPLSGSDPVRFGASGMVSFSPDGTATAGSVYVRGRGGAQYVIRVFGDTGKTQALRFDAARRAWMPL